MRMDMSSDPACLRDFEISSSAHEAISAHHDRGFGYCDLFFSATFMEPTIPLVLPELNLNADPSLIRALVFSDAADFSFDSVMVLGGVEQSGEIVIPRCRKNPDGVWKMEGNRRYGTVQSLGWLEIHEQRRFYACPGVIGAMCDVFAKYSRHCK